MATLSKKEKFALYPFFLKGMDGENVIVKNVNNFMDNGGFPQKAGDSVDFAIAACWQDAISTGEGTIGEVSDHLEYVIYQLMKFKDNLS